MKTIQERFPQIKSYVIEIEETSYELGLHKSHGKKLFRDLPSLPVYEASYPKHRQFVASVDLTALLWVACGEKKTEKTKIVRYESSIGDDNSASIHIKCSITYKEEEDNRA